MPKTHLLLNESNLPAAQEYLQQQLDNHSWWPTEQPGLAKQEFKLMRGSADALTVWCEKWLDASQIKQLEKNLKKKNT